MGTIADIVWINILFILFSLPIVTIGASLTALYGTCMRLHDENEGSVTRTFWKIFRTNFWASTGMWVIFGCAGLGLAAAWFYFPGTEFLPLKSLFTAAYLFVFPFPWVLQATFVNSFFGTLKNSIFIPLGRLPYVLGTFAVGATISSLFLVTAWKMPAILPPLVLAGFGLLVYAQAPLLRKTLSPWLAVSEGISHPKAISTM